MTAPTIITVQTTISAPITYVWECWTTPTHITQWNAASPDWHTPHSAVDLQVGGTFSSRMEAKDGSFGFDFWGTYTIVNAPTELAYTLGDDRKVSIQFVANGDNTTVIEQFEAEQTNPVDMQRAGWQAILDNFAAYATRTQPA
jgi:uncharacterized protein YndB with AHSA1/START domain